MQYAENLVRSAIEPETMVAAVAQNTVWKIRVVKAEFSLTIAQISAEMRNTPKSAAISISEPENRTKVGDKTGHFVKQQHHHHYNSGD